MVRAVARACLTRTSAGRLLLTSGKKSGAIEEYRQSRIVLDFRVPGELKLELADETAPSEGFVRFKADYRSVARVPAPPAPRQPRRFVIA